MTTALLDEKVEFVKLFVMNGLVMEDYLTVDTLRSLYNKAVSLARRGFSCEYKHM